MKLRMAALMLAGLTAGGGRSLAGADLVPSPQDHWSFQPITRPALPSVGDSSWVRNPIDAFVLNRLESLNLAPSPPADRHTLIRRLSLDLTGLPPTPEQVRAFVEDTRPDAYAQCVDRLLHSPHFGEQWARHWLDLARYADSDGYEKDTVRPWAWRYRDWVIAAIQADMPFDQFTREQLAGDVLPDATLEQRVATGFHRNTLTNKEGGVDQEEFRCKAVVDRVNTTGTVWLGLTVACAECHTHKYDPITHEEYFQLFAFFNNADEADIPAPRPEEQRDYQSKLDLWTLAEDSWRQRLSGFENRSLLPRFQTWLRQAETQEPLPENLVSFLSLEPDQRTAEQQQALLKHFRSHDPEWQSLQKQHQAHLESKPEPPPTQAQTLVQSSKDRPTHVHIRGDFLRHGSEVHVGTPAVLHPFQPRPNQPDRVSLANWLMAPDNPLTARVTVNRLWQQLFGQGLVATPDDFGTRGEKPSHPHLLDWLASEFRAQQWSRRAIIRLIVLSNTYRQTSSHRPELHRLDPLNRWLARQNRFRLSAENVRDNALAVSGLLTRTVGGPSVRPPLPDDIAALGYANSVRWKESTGPDKYRRGMYILFQRTVPYPMLTTFDAPDGALACTRRERSNTPLQALTLLNDPVFFECAQHLGWRIWFDHLDDVPSPDVAARVQALMLKTLARNPTLSERQRLLALHEQHRGWVEDHPDEAEQLAGLPQELASHTSEVAPWVALSRVVLNLDEFITRE